jgi:fructose-1,6-bisphosphatase/sedoheptulose 1,7-bisphosphatase-like protein
MGCVLTMTEKDLKQIKQTQRSSPQTAKQILKTAAVLAEMAPSALPYYLKQTIGQASHQMGKVGEQIAARVLEQSRDLRVVEMAKAQGVDIKMQGKGQISVAVEVKTSVQGKPFNQLLGEGYGHKQCSDGWLKAVGVNPTQITVMGVHINPETETVSVYQRQDSGATQWRCIMRDAPLSRFNIS